MKRYLIVAMVVIAALTLGMSAMGEDMPAMAMKGDTISVEGTLGCLHCNMKNPANPGTKECCQHCVQTGDPAILKADNDTWYVLTKGDHDQPLATPEFVAMVGEKVKVEGQVFKNKGLQAIFVTKCEVVPKAEADQ